MAAVVALLLSACATKQYESPTPVGESVTIYVENASSERVTVSVTPNKTATLYPSSTKCIDVAAVTLGSSNSITIASRGTTMTAYVPTALRTEPGWRLRITDLQSETTGGLTAAKRCS
jgi:uncharacterized lipoprotein YbaY